MTLATLIATGLGTLSCSEETNDAVSSEPTDSVAAPPEPAPPEEQTVVEELLFLEDTVVWNMLADGDVLYMAGFTQAATPPAPAGYPRDYVATGTRFFVARYDGMQLTWWREYKGAGWWLQRWRVELAPGPDGGVWVAGDFSGDLVGDGVHLEPEGDKGWPTFLLQLDKAGEAVHAQVLNDQTAVKTWSWVRLVPGPEGDVYILLSASGRVMFGDVEYQTLAEWQGESDQLVARMGPGGVHRWSHHLGNGGSDDGWRAPDGGLILSDYPDQLLPEGFKGEPPWTLDLEEGPWRIHFDLDGNVAGLEEGRLGRATGDPEGGCFGIGNTDFFWPIEWDGPPDPSHTWRVRLGTAQDVLWVAPPTEGLGWFSNWVETPSFAPLAGGGAVHMTWVGTTPDEYGGHSHKTFRFAGQEFEPRPTPMVFGKGIPEDIALVAWDDQGSELAAVRVGTDTWSGPLPDGGTGVSVEAYALTPIGPREVLWSYHMHASFDGDWRSYSSVRSWSW